MAELVIVSGISGAGKSHALKAFEDLGYYCVDNVLPQIIMEIAGIVGNAGMKEFKKIALVVDIRGGEFFKGIHTVLDLLDLNGVDYKVLFLDARDDVLINRYKETRRAHPLSRDGMISVGIALERKLTEQLKTRAAAVIDTSALSPKELKQRIFSLFGADGRGESSGVLIISFGFKRGLPDDCDYVYDCRFLLNPFNVEALRHHTGLDADVVEYVFAQGAASGLVKNIAAMLKLVLKDYRREVKPTLVLGIGCTGGKHRSVAIAERLFKLLEAEKISAAVRHRDIYID
jgi:UPF0042 nucleotide-binding protein